MRSRRFKILLVATSILGGWIWCSNTGSTPTHIDSTLPSEIVSIPQDFRHTPVSTPLMPKASTIKHIDKPLGLWSKLENTNFESALENAKDASALVNLIEEGQNETPSDTPFTGFHDRWLKACESFSAQNRLRERGDITAQQWREATQLCVIHGVAYQKMLRGKKFSDLSLENENDIEKLKERLFYEYQTAQWLAAANSAEQWIALDSDETTAKWARLSSLTQWIASQGMTQEKNAEIWQRVIASLNALPRDEVSLPYELYLSYLRRLNPADLLALAQQKAKQHPQSPVPSQFLAIAAWEMGDKTLATQYWERYIELLPVSQREEAEATLVRIKANVRKPFRLSLTLDHVLLQAHVSSED